MNNMTKEEKAKRYDEALERAKKWYYAPNANKTPTYANRIIKEIFPELKESEDEKIRKALIDYFDDANKADENPLQCYDIHTDKAIDWLERQGEQKPTLPKWKYKKDNTPLLRDSIILNKYGCVAKSPSGALVSDVWVIDYDELAKLPKEEIEKQDEQKPYGQRKECEDCQFSYVGECKGDCALKRNEQKSAEEYNITGIGSKNAQGKLGEMIKNLKPVNEVLEQKPADWSEEDERMYNRIYDIVHSAAFSNYETDENGKECGEYAKIIGWLKSIKDKVQPKQEWGEEDESTIKDIIEDLEYAEAKGYVLKNNIFLKEINWLKSLNPQSHWKPTKEQMNTMKYLAKYYAKGCDEPTRSIIEGLYEQLKQL